MRRNAFSNMLGMKSKDAVVNIILIANALIWYFYAFRFLWNIADTGLIPDEITVVFGFNFLSIAVAALLNPILMYRVKRRFQFIFYWMLAGVGLSFFLLGVDIATFSSLLIVSVLFGAYFGLGMPTCLGYFAASTEAGNRSRLAGLAFLIVSLGFFLFMAIGIEGVLFNAIILSIVKSAGLLLLIFLKPDEKQINQGDQMSYSYVIKNRSFLLYFIPWLTFALVNFVAVPIVDIIAELHYPEDIVILFPIIENVTAGICAVVFGFLADLVGRKRLVLAGFSLLGVGYGCLGLFQNYIYAWWFYTIVDGVAWGVFYTIFIMTLWGDLAHNKSSEKYYAIGSLPFLFSNFMRLSIYEGLANVPGTAIFSFAGFFLFVAVLPLIYAPETLPAKKIKERELKGYLEKAKKEAEKYSKSISTLEAK